MSSGLILLMWMKASALQQKQEPENISILIKIFWSPWNIFPHHKSALGQTCSGWWSASPLRRPSSVPEDHQHLCSIIWLNITYVRASASPIPVSESCSQLTLPPPPVVKVEGENGGVLGQGPGQPDVAVVLRHNQGDGHGQTYEGQQQPD